MSNDVRILAVICLCLVLTFVWLVAERIVQRRSQTLDHTVETETNSLEGEK